MHNQDYRSLNASLAFKDMQGNYPLENDKLAVKLYFLNHVNQNTVFFHSLEEKLDYLVENGFYNEEILDLYEWKDIKDLYKFAYSFKFRFKAFVGALKFYNSYALKTEDKSRYLERYEDRIVAYSLEIARGNVEFAKQLIEEVITGRFQPATPTFLNTLRKNAGKNISCFLVSTSDSMVSITKTINAALHLSSMGGGVGISLSNLRERGATIKQYKNAASGILPVMKILEDSFTYANQLGQRQGAGAVFVHAHHPDIMEVLDSKRENADEKIRIKTLSLGIVIPDITFELAKNNEDMYLFSPYEIKKYYGKELTEFSITENYETLVADERITKKKIPARKFFTTLAEIQTQSGYPYIMFEDTANRENNNSGYISQSNICTEILIPQTPSQFYDNGEYKVIGSDISCNLGSMNIAHALRGGNLAKTVELAVRALTSVSDNSKIDIVPTVQRGNDLNHFIGLGQMNLHGFLASEGIKYGSQESIEFVDRYFETILFHALETSCNIAQERSETYDGFEDSKYATGEFFDYYLKHRFISSDKVNIIFKKYNVIVPLSTNWNLLKAKVMRHGLYNSHLLAVAPTGSISYINNSTPSIAPITDIIEGRKEGNLGKVYHPAFELSNENKDLYEDAYEIGYEKLIDVYAAAQKHVDQGISMTLYFKSGIDTRTINKSQIYAWKKGIKTIYYVRIKKEDITENAECESCSI